MFKSRIWNSSRVWWPLSLMNPKLRPSKRSHLLLRQCQPHNFAVGDCYVTAQANVRLNWGEGVGWRLHVLHKPLQFNMVGPFPIESCQSLVAQSSSNGTRHLTRSRQLGWLISLSLHLRLSIGLTDAINLWDENQDPTSSTSWGQSKRLWRSTSRKKSGLNNKQGS